MGAYYYDLHVHSCLSPCADNDNTPGNIAGMASLCGLDIVALTDHNSCKNCPAFFEAAERVGIVPVAGMELTTSEDIHIVCLFATLEDAMAFDAEIDKRRILIRNRTDIFGEQLITDGLDNVVGTEEYLLTNATSVSLGEAYDITRRFHGVSYPAHIDREANGIISVLGVFPESPPFSCFELHDGEKTDEYTERYGLGERKMIVSSDAHRLTELRDRQYFFETDGTPSGSEQVRRSLINYLESHK